MSYVKVARTADEERGEGATHFLTPGGDEVVLHDPTSDQQRAVMVAFGWRVVTAEQFRARQDERLGSIEERVDRELGEGAS